MLDKVFNYFSYYQWWKNLDKFILSLVITLFLTGLFFLSSVISSRSGLNIEPGSLGMFPTEFVTTLNIRIGIKRPRN